MKQNKHFLRTLSVFCLLLFFSQTMYAQVSGVVFRDFNANGVRDNSAGFVEPFVEGVTVTAFPVSGASQSTTTAVNGAYSFTGLTLPVRIEFSGFPQGDFSTISGAESMTSIQFYNASASDADFGIYYPMDYCEENPKIVYTCFENGSGVGNTNPVILQHDLSPVATSGLNEYYSDGTAERLGTVYGLAYDRSAELIYTSAMLKRQAGIGERGYDGIYVIASGALVGGLDLEGVMPVNGGPALQFGTVTRNLIASGSGTGVNDLSAARNLASRDADAYGKVGKIGFGDIDFDQERKVLWAVNLNERSLVAIDLSVPLHNTSNPNTVPGANVSRFFIDNIAGSPFITGLPTCSNGTMRPFGLTIYRDKGYLGVVCDGSNLSQVDMTANEQAYVLSFDLDNPVSFTLEASLPLNYPREQSWVPFAATGLTALDSDQWQRWHDVYNEPPTEALGSTLDIKRGSFGFVGAPQPILADIEFDEQGNMVLGFIDRFAHQQGWANYIPTSSTILRRAVSHGDLVYGYNTGSGYDFEGPVINDNFTNPVVPLDAQPTLLLNDGPSGMGEFFYKDYFVGFDATHPETSLGGLALKPGSRELTSIVFDPNAFNSMGIRWFSMETGNETRFYTAIANTDIENFGKGAALGDIELQCGLPEIEIGNRVWNDQNNNGIQDPGEPGISSVEVTLWKDDGMGNFTQIAAATTDANGNYYFSSASGTTTASTIFDVSDLLPGMGYELRFPTSVGGFDITLANNGGMDANADARDSDADASGVVAFMTGGAGANNHNFDVGYGCPPSVCQPTGVVKN